MPTNVNYVNPSAGGTPYGDWKPQGFLSGWQYADKMKDYRTTKDLSDESSFLANEMTRMTNEDYGRGADLRSVQREILKQRGGHELNRIPTEEGIKGMQADEQYSSLYNPRGKEARIEKTILDSINSLDKTKRDAAVSNSAAASTLLQSMSLDGDPNLIIQELGKRGVVTSGLHDPNPEVVRQKLFKLQRSDPERLKSEYERAKQADIDFEALRRERERLASNEKIAGMKSHAVTAAEQKEKRLQEYEQAYIKIMSKPASQRTAEEQAQLNYIEMVLRSYQGQQEAIAEREVTSPGRTIDSFEGKPTAKEPRSTAKSSGKTMTLPEVGEVEVLEQLPGGAIKFRKGNRTGTWRP